MTPTPFRTSILLVLALSLAACELAGDIFQAGFWVGIIIVLLIVALIAWFLQRGKS